MSKQNYMHCSKETFVRRVTVEEAVCAVAQFSDVNIAIVRCFKCLGISPGGFTEAGVVSSN